jgi:transcriptional antiterminator Rof (Rho-off)
MDPKKKTSHSALTTTTKMMQDVAYDHLRHVTPDSVDGLPLTCLYKLLSAIEHIRNGQYMIDNAADKFSAADMDLLVALDTMIADR